MPPDDPLLRFIRSISLVIARRTTARSTTAITTISSTRSPIASHVDQFSSTQPAAFVALSWASFSEGTVGVVGDGDGEGDDADEADDADDEPAAGRTAADRDTAETSRCGGPSCAVRSEVRSKVTERSPDGQMHHTNGAPDPVRPETGGGDVAHPRLNWSRSRPGAPCGRKHSQPVTGTWWRYDQA
ncbi:hypothetical protein GCM10010095_10250 [Streptomyces anthocyanicus]|uniref:Uncharacterized protein n=1 Tax=Streptomyces violaceolatus TaxID=67378 RepID=A0ABN3SNQ3_9ACTN|nr:hypothetical protein JCM4020_28320 [Streptomyces coelicolor]GGL27116.1 hypothetical protein GCM10010095_10250 [Streptomyces anthocyanicus]GHA45528.1 hypothetical protein GCM10010391_32430 [Streptomyces anthocyanicus]GHB97859.1 hypothetical protein GCM10010348_16880 [Streptomyces anthocyanicus]